jgi:hypothetical protein
MAASEAFDGYQSALQHGHPKAGEQYEHAALGF